MKFDTLQQIWNLMAAIDKIWKFSKNLRWRTAAILKIVCGHNSAADCLISVKFCRKRRNTTAIDYERGHITWTTIFTNSRRGRAPSWKLLNHHISEPKLSDFDDIGTQQQIWNSVTVTWPKMIFLNSRWRTADTFKIVFLAITQQLIVRFQWNFAQETE